MACANAAAPLLLPWTNVSVSQDGKAVSRGIEIAVGTPKQVFSLRPTTSDVNTWLFNIADCVSTSNDSCIGTAGGAYSPQLSSTYELSTKAGWNGSQSTNEDGSFIYFNDIINFGMDGTIYGYPMNMDQPGQGSQSGLPLANGSSFLSAVVNTNQAPSQGWGLWTGSRSISNPIDGMLVVGGYDTARVEGEFTNFTSSGPDCLSCVNITSLTYNTVKGSTSLFSNSSEVLQVNLDPFHRDLQVPPDIFWNFVQATGAFYNTTLGSWAYSVYNPPEGNMTVTLENGYKTTIPSSELFSQARLYQNNVYSIVYPELVISELSNFSSSQFYSDWGIPFLTMNYMIMDYDNSQFRMAPANRTNTGLQGGSKIEKLCAEIVITPSPSSAPSSSATPTAAPNHQSNTGAIVGGVVGGVLGLALIAGIIFFLLRSRRRKNAATAEQNLAEQPNMSDRKSSIPLPAYSDSPHPGFSELPSAAPVRNVDANQSGTLSSGHWSNPTSPSEMEDYSRESTHFVPRKPVPNSGERKSPPPISQPVFEMPAHNPGGNTYQND